MLDVSRKELKYIIPLREVYEIKQKLSSVMSQDAHGKGEGYRVRSLYFDTLFDNDFEDKVDGYDKRQKIRLRIYDTNASTVKLELKQKDAGGQRKRSLSISRQEAQRMITGDYEFLLEHPEELAKSLYTFMITRSYRPKCVVEYDRLAYYRNENDIRITFDMNLRATESNFDIFDEDLILYPVAKPDEVTLEVKFNGFLYSYIKKIINRADKMQVSNSKYCRARRISKRGRI